MRDVTTRFADDDSELTFVVEKIGGRRIHDRFVVRDMRVGVARKNDRIFGFARGIALAAHVVIELHANDLVGIGHDEIEFHVAKRNFRFGFLGQAFQQVLGYGGLKIGRVGAGGFAEIGDLVADNRAI